jgi:hypothetical protein
VGEGLSPEVDLRATAVYTSFFLSSRTPPYQLDRDIEQENTMRKAIFVIFLAALVTSGPIVNATCVLERVYNYYTDSTFSTACGYVDIVCGTTYSDGCTTSWRYAETYSLQTGEQTSANCQEWNGSQWVNVACPDETVTAQTRIHIPVGRE